MNIKMTINSQVSKTESKKQKQTKQTRTGTESKKWRPFGGLSVGRGKGTEIYKHNWQVQNRQEDVKNSIGNGEAKELICMTPGHDQRE